MQCTGSRQNPDIWLVDDVFERNSACIGVSRLTRISSLCFKQIFSLFCFALIPAYVGIGKKNPLQRHQKIDYHWIKTFVAVLFLIFLVSENSSWLRSLMKHIMPFTLLSMVLFHSLREFLFRSTFTTFDYFGSGFFLRRSFERYKPHTKRYSNESTCIQLHNIQTFVQ